MKSNELRIDNWVYNPIQKIPLRVDFNVLNLIRLDNKFDREDKFQSIPLTEEILLKCGFENNNYQDSLSLKLMSNGVINAYGVSDRIRLEIGTQNGYIFGNSEVRHLHQLQNLYFALTNKELKIEL